MPEGELGSIAEQIHAEAVRRAEQELDRARRVAERHVNAARVQVEEMEEALQRELTVLLKQAVERKMARAEIEARKRKLGLREEVYDEVTGAALKKLADVNRDEAYLRALERLALEGLKELRGNEAKLMVNSEDGEFLRDGGRMKRLVEFLREKLGGEVKVELSDEPIETAGGLMLASADGRIAYHNTFEEILRRLRREIAVKVNGKVFQEENG